MIKEIIKNEEWQGEWPGFVRPAFRTCEHGVLKAYEESCDSCLKPKPETPAEGEKE